MKPLSNNCKRAPAKTAKKTAGDRRVGSNPTETAGLPEGLPKVEALICGNSPFAVFCIDRNYRLLYANLRFFEFIQDNFETRLKTGDCALDLLPKSRRSMWQSRLDEVFGGQYLRVEEVMESEYGARFFDVAYQPILHPDGNELVIVYFDEVTVRRRREQKLKATEDALRGVIQARETLLSVISHDLRSPIFQLNALLYNIRASSKARDEQRLQMHAEDLEERVAHLTHTLDNLLSWSNLNRQNVLPQVSEFSVSALCDHAIGLFKPNAQRKRLKIVLNADPKDAKLRSDPELVAFIVRNLVNNAIKFSMEGGTVAIDAVVSATGLELKVVDRGTGISSKKLSSLKAHKSLESEAGTLGERGTGLGLSLTYEFVQRLHGLVDISSKKGRGTCVLVDIPHYAS